MGHDTMPKWKMLIEFAKCLALVISAVAFPIVQSSKQFDATIKKEYFNKKEDLLREYSKEILFYISTYSAYLKISRCMSDENCIGNDKDYYLGLSRDESAAYRLKLRDALVSRPECEAILNEILLYYSSKDLRVLVDSMKNNIQNLESLMHDKFYSPNRCNDLVNEMNSIYVRTLDVMSVEVKNYLQGSG